MESTVQKFDLSRLARRQPNMLVDLPKFRFGGWKLKWKDGKEIHPPVENIGNNFENLQVVLEREDGYSVTVSWFENHRLNRWEDAGWYIEGNRVKREDVWLIKYTTFTDLVKAAEVAMIRIIAGRNLVIPEAERLLIYNNFQREKYNDKAMEIWRGF